jgi:hypothetical protein
MQEFRQTIRDQTFSHCRKDTCSKLWNLDSIENFDHIEQPRLPTILYFQDLDYNSKIFSFEFKSRINDKLKF